MFGATLRRAKLLDRITVNGPSSAPVRSYRFLYQVHPQSGRSRLESAELCDASDVCLPATEFEWSDDASTTLIPDEWGTEDLVEEQEAFVDAEQVIVGNFGAQGDPDSFGDEEILLRDVDAYSRWKMWFGPHGDPLLPPVSVRVITPAGFAGQNVRASPRLGRAALVAA
jgi:hypothetical protein